MSHGDDAAIRIGATQATRRPSAEVCCSSSKEKAGSRHHLVNFDGTPNLRGTLHTVGNVDEFVADAEGVTERHERVPRAAPAAAPAAAAAAGRRRRRRVHGVDAAPGLPRLRRRLSLGPLLADVPLAVNEDHWGASCASRGLRLVGRWRRARPGAHRGPRRDAATPEPPPRRGVPPTYPAVDVGRIDGCKPPTGSSCGPPHVGRTGAARGPQPAHYFVRPVRGRRAFVVVSRRPSSGAAGSRCARRYTSASSGRGGRQYIAGGL